MTFWKQEQDGNRSAVSCGGGILAIDLGKTSCRVEVTADGQVLASARGDGFPGLAARDGAAAAYAAVMRAVRFLASDVRERITHCAVSVAGAESAKSVAEAFARHLRAEFGVPVAVITDILAAHLGAFDGGCGTALVAGTGAVAYGLSAAGTFRRVDGWGPWLGDDGGGRWIGQHGLQRALRFADGRDSYTSLLEAAERLAGGVENLPSWTGGSASPARNLASFAPVVLEHAREGDPAAFEIAREAANLLAVCALAATSADKRVATLGGLTADEFFDDLILDAQRQAGLEPVVPISDALTGVARIATRTDLPHERYVTRD